MKISILIPVYNKPKLLKDILKKIINNEYKNKEIIVIVDGATNNDIENALKENKNKIKVIYNKNQLGKAKSLNNEACKLDTDIFVFLDNDILLTDDINFLDNLVIEIKNHDIVEFPKEAISKNIISGMLGIEFLSFAIACFSFSKISNKCPSMNGAAFAIRKEIFLKLDGFKYVINEDMDLASRAFVLNARYSYNPKLKVYNSLPLNFKEWFVQRKRWATNNVLWLKNNIGLIIKYFIKDPNFRKSFSILFLPFILYLILYFILHALGFTSLLPYIILISLHFHLFLGKILSLVYFDYLFHGIIPILLGTILTGIYYFIFSKILKFKFNILSFLLFYFIYTPIFLFVNIYYGIALLFKIKINLDWKITK